MSIRIPYGHQTIDASDIAAVAKTLRSDWLTQGPKVAEFESALAEYCGARHAVAFANGTAALQAAYFAAGLKPGDEFITSPMTFAATATAGLWQGARPVFADVDPATGNLDPKACAKLLNKRTRAIVPVDYAGLPADLPAFRRLAKERGLVVIEDACHALGTRLGKRRIGSISDMTIFSFHPVKHLTTGEGGMITTDRDDLARRLRKFRSHGITKVAAEMEHDEGPWYYEMQDLGYNYRITDFQCALGLSQLRKADGFVRARRSLAALYDRALAGYNEVATPTVRSWARHSYHLYPLRLRLDRISRTRRQVFEALRAQGLGVQVHYVPVHLQPYYRKRFGTGKGLCPAAEAFYESEISLPLYPRMTPSDVRRVVAALHEAVGS
jgi:UDP-4-amino-4,6-dideoxy-N-acetyl-beta-L-altrosamine transaminase